MKEIQLTQGKVALVDDDMYEELNQHKWFAHKRSNLFYATRKSPTIKGKRHMIHMHNEIIGMPPRGLMIDHKDGDSLRNLRSNLRFVTNRQNCQNRRYIKIEKTSKYPGVSWHKKGKKWQARIRINGKRKSLGLFTDELAAFAAYKKAVNELGEELLQLS